MATRMGRKFYMDSAPDEYGSVRPEGFSENLGRLDRLSNERAKSGATEFAKGTAKSMIPAVGMAMSGENFSKGIRDFKTASDVDNLSKSLKSSADRELSNQVKRESRGVKEEQEDLGSAMKKGGKVNSASKRGDGIAQRGKTRGTIVMCGGGYMKGKK